jgi:hypothetical protein
MTIAPSDAAVAARSFPRRWKALFASVPEDAGDLLDRGSPSARGLAARARDALAAASARLGGALAPPGGDELAGLSTVALELADRVEATDGALWARDPGSIELLSRSIDEAATALRQAEKVLEKGRGEA